jgi:hypothetical protein
MTKAAEMAVNFILILKDEIESGQCGRRKVLESWNS